MKKTEKTISFDEFKSELFLKWGNGNVMFRESGKHGWTSIDVSSGELKLVPGNKGPHWCDASPIGDNPTPPRYLLGSYNFNNGIATFYW